MLKDGLRTVSLRGNGLALINRKRVYSYLHIGKMTLTIFLPVARFSSVARVVSFSSITILLLNSCSCFADLSGRIKTVVRPLE